MWLKTALEYITNPIKTDDKMLVSSFGCSHETALEEFKLTLSKSIEKGNNKAHHLMQAFEPGETTPEQAHEIGKRLADIVTQGKHEYILTTHIDKGHVHNHIIFCAANFVDYRKYKSNKFTLKDIRKRSDELCKEYGLSVVDPTKNKGKSYAEYTADRYGGGSWKSKLKTAIDNLIPKAENFEDLLKHLQTLGYEIKRGKHISVRADGQERFTRLKTLGIDYTEENLRKRILGEYTPTPEKTQKTTEFIFDEPEESFDIFNMVFPTDPQPYVRPVPVANLIVDVQNCIKAQHSAGFARWQKIQNLKEAAKTLNFLTENNLLHHSDLENEAAEVNDDFAKTGDTLKAVEKRLASMGAVIKQVDSYQRTKAVYDTYASLSGRKKEAYRRGHNGDIIIHEATVRVLRKHADKNGKLPNPSTLKAKHQNLTNRKNNLRTEYDRLRSKARDLGVIQRNVDSILDPAPEQRRRAKARDAEL